MSALNALCRRCIRFVRYKREKDSDKDDEAIEGEEPAVTDNEAELARKHNKDAGMISFLFIHFLNFCFFE